MARTRIGTWSSLTDGYQKSSSSEHNFILFRCFPSPFCIGGALESQNSLWDWILLRGHAGLFCAIHLLSFIIWNTFSSKYLQQLVEKRTWGRTCAHRKWTRLQKIRSKRLCLEKFLRWFPFFHFYERRSAWMEQTFHSARGTERGNQSLRRKMVELARHNSSSFCSSTYPYPCHGNYRCCYH